MQVSLCPVASCSGGEGSGHWEGVGGGESAARGGFRMVLDCMTGAWSAG